ncbi:MAG: hypothetical protein KatS3mg111_1619 [Pirellulaceae bacterium]|nr:MAG: hypothetical protein KatS3mg111_1619 [Pirellulaceae bacterium]
MAEMAMNDVATDRPVLHGELNVGEDIPPLSRMAVFSLLVGVLASFSIFSSLLVPLCVIAAVFSAVTLWYIDRNQAVRGRALAQTGLALSVLSATWSLTSLNGHHRYLYQVAAQHAEDFLTTLASGQKYVALELMRPEHDRKVTGTDLARYYQEAEPETREVAESFLRDEVTKFVMAQGPDAQWKFVRGISVREYGSRATVTVEVRNERARGKRDRVWVELQRSEGQVVRQPNEAPVAIWHVVSVKFPDEP